jgi:hypothetical protein
MQSQVVGKQSPVDGQDTSHDQLLKALPSSNFPTAHICFFVYKKHIDDVE